MYRFAGLALVVTSVGPAFAGNPTPIHKPTSAPAQVAVVKQATHADVTAPLSTAIATAPVTVHGYPGDASCVGGTCGADGCRVSRPCLTRLRDWLFFQPGPRCVPTFIPTPYQAPLRSYFQCKSDCACIVGGCHLGNCGGCNDGSCGPRMRGYGLAPRGMIGARPCETATCQDGPLARLFGGNSCKYGPPTGQWPANEMIGHPAAGYTAWGGSGLSPVGGAPAWTNSTGVHFAAPNTVPTPVQQSAYKPFTNP